MAPQNMILSAETATRKLKRMAFEVCERNYGSEEILLLGIKDNGVFIAREIASFMKEAFAGKITIADLSINKKEPGEITLSEHLDFNDKVIVLVDDVANSGRTMLYALKPLLLHFPRKIQTLALVERTHKLFPIAVDYVGVSVSTTQQENIEVEIVDGKVGGAWLK
jgi:pyrimidine operon attenuation protein/uracil phosphoribosyltransferase